LKWKIWSKESRDTVESFNSKWSHSCLVRTELLINSMQNDKCVL
jgi:hypothetical protein